MKNLLAFDIETSGLNCFLHDLLSLALVPVDPEQYEKIGPIELYHNPSGHVVFDSWARENFKAKIKDRWEKQKLYSSDLAWKLEAYIDQFDDTVTLVGHNVGSFDIPFLKALYHRRCRATPYRVPRKISYRSVDTHSLLWSLSERGHLPREACSSTGAFRWFGIEVDGNRRHTAEGDATATAQLYRAIMALERSLDW